MRTAFKEWAVVVDALGRGDQIIILRKGGISEERGDFHLEHSEFMLFPTLYHQQRESVVPAAQERYDVIAPELSDATQVRLEYFARVVESHRLESLAVAQSLRGQHIWRDEVIAQRFDWGKERNIFALAVRVHRLPAAQVLPVLPAYGGCKSWVQLETDIPDAGATAVLSDAAFAEKLHSARATFDFAAAA